MSSRKTWVWGGYKESSANVLGGSVSSLNWDAAQLHKDPKFMAASNGTVEVCGERQGNDSARCPQVCWAEDFCWASCGGPGVHRCASIPCCFPAAAAADASCPLHRFSICPAFALGSHCLGSLPCTPKTCDPSSSLGLGGLDSQPREPDWQPAALQYFLPWGTFTSGLGHLRGGSWGCEPRALDAACCDRLPFSTGSSCHLKVLSELGCSSVQSTGLACSRLWVPSPAPRTKSKDLTEKKSLFS